MKNKTKNFCTLNQKICAMNDFYFSSILTYLADFFSSSLNSPLISQIWKSKCVKSFFVLSLSKIYVVSLRTKRSIFRYNFLQKNHFYYSNLFTFISLTILNVLSRRFNVSISHTCPVLIASFFHTCLCFRFVLLRTLVCPTPMSFFHVFPVERFNVSFFTHVLVSGLSCKED